MANQRDEYEIEYPDKDYDKDAFDRIWGDGKTFMTSNEYRNTDSTTLEERAIYLQDNGYVEKHIPLDAVIEKLRQLDAVNKEEGIE